MTLSRDHNDITFQCDGDGCYSSLHSETSNFDAARNVLNRNRWSARKRTSDDTWLHFCPTCQGPMTMKPALEGKRTREKGFI